MLNIIYRENDVQMVFLDEARQAEHIWSDLCVKRALGWEGSIIYQPFMDTNATKNIN